MTEPSEILQKELKEKQICRFCLTQDNLRLTSIHSRQNRFNNSAPLPLQVMACVSIEVFFNDGMPSYVCGECRLVFEHAYRFKQMCKKADTILRQYPLTGKWPSPLEKPKIPEELFPKVNVMKVLNKPPITAVKEESPPPASEVSVEKFIIQTDNSPSQFKVVSSSPNQFSSHKSLPVKPRVLNKNSIKILNKEAGNTIFEPVLSRPIIKRDMDGNVEVVSEILEAENVRQIEPDPVETAIPIETNVFPCPHCERSFPLKQLLDIHMVNHKRERSFECSHCDKRFFSKYDLSKHVLIHTGEKPYKCVVCSKAFTRSTLLSRHEKVHTDIPKYLCVYCEKEFLSKDELEKHTSRHTKNRPFSCRICSKAFAFKQGLERHEVVHSKNQPFPCQYCDLSFSTSSKLSRHLTAHAGERPYPCKLCPKSYLLSHHLTRHLRSHKEGSGSYNCCECKQVFSSRDDLIYHSAVHATQNLVCPLCKEAFHDLDTVTKHIEDHAEGEQYACEFCDLIYMTADRLQAHSNLEHSEDMAAYEDHLDQPNYIPKSENDDPESEQIIEEFIIEQYDDDNLDAQEEEEEAWESEITAKGEPSKKRPHSVLNSYSAISTKIEEMDPMDESSLLSELIDDPAPTPAKVVKIEKEEFPQLRVVSKPTTKSVLQNEKTQVKNENTSKEFKESSTLKSMIKTLPKTVTITRKSEVKAEETKILPTREFRQRRSDGNPKPIEDKSEKSSSMTEARAPLMKSLRSAVEKKPEQRALNNDKVKKLNVSKPSIVSGSTRSKSPAASTSKSPSPSTSTSTPTGSKQLVEMTIGNRRVKVQKITVSKAQAAAMSKEGRIEMKDGTMILKQSDIPGKRRIVKKIPT